MTGTALTLADRSALRAALSAMKFGPPGAEWRFEAELAARNGWSAGHAARVVEEYRRFLYLAAISEIELTPSRAVDEAWHLHLEDERHYREELCGRVLGRPLAHLPGTGAAGEEARFADQYAATLALYRDAFGEPPDDIWPTPAAGAQAQEGRRFPAARLGLAALAGAIVAAAFENAALTVAFALLAAACLVSIFLALAGTGRASRRREAGGGCGGSCGGGYASDGEGGASCGGGCGGD